MKPFLPISIALCLFACNQQENGLTSQTPSTELQPGQLQLVRMNGMAKVSATANTSKDSTVYEFDLDTAKSSIQQYFILQNTGDFDCKNVKLTTNNPKFYFTPSSFSVLPPSKGSSLLQVIKLSVIHGVRLDGIGSDSLLPMGNNTATVQLTATSTNSRHDVISLSQSASMNVFAKVMDIYAFSDSTPIDLFHPNGTLVGTAFPFGAVDYYTTFGICKFVNSGNVNIMVREWNNGQTIVLDSAVLRPGDSFFPATYKGTGAFGSVELDGNGVISNSRKFRRTTDERIFLMFR